MDVNMVTKEENPLEIFTMVLNGADLVHGMELPELSPSGLFTSFENSQDTMEADIKFEHENIQIPFPNGRSGPPERNNFSGRFDFEINVNSIDANKKKYIYSHKLNRIYVDMGCKFPIQFVWKNTYPLQTMFVRATTVFSDESQRENRVFRCVQHEQPLHNLGAQQNIIQHVLRSTRDIGTEGVFYCGSESTNSWYSVLVAFPPNEDGTNAHTHAYQFVCKNSCNTGINRRAIEIIFTLEDRSGTVHGRQVVGVRVCSCPKRDKIKDEGDEAKPMSGKKRSINHKGPPGLPPKKKAELPNSQELEDDNQVYTLQVQVVGKQVVETGLHVMIKMMELKSSMSNSNPQQLRQIIDDMKNLRLHYTQ